MPGCSAVNCTNRSEKSRMMRFPRNPERNVKWVHNMRRKNWTPTNSARLCENHFEESQFEQNRNDGWRKLKPNAIPTLFDIPNPPPMINPPPRNSLYKKNNESGYNSATEQSPMVQLKNLTDSIGKTCTFEPDVPSLYEDTDNTSIPLLETEACLECQKIKKLWKHEREQIIQNWKDDILKYQKSQEMMQKTIEDMKKLMHENMIFTNEKVEKLNKIRNSTKSFLNKAQISKLEQGAVREWSNEAIIKGLKLRFALSISGYNYLLKSGYPSPSYSTLARRIQDLKLEFGIFQDVLKLLKHKVDVMEPSDKFCVISYDEMAINPILDYDKSNGKLIGYVTLDPVVSDQNWEPCNEDLGGKILLVVVKGIKNHWKQIIACHVTRTGFGRDVNEEIKNNMRQKLKDFILECISAVEQCGLRVVTLSSDLDSRNVGIWKSLGIQVTADGIRRNSFVHNDHHVYTQPDVCHMEKNLKSAMLRQIIYLCPKYVEHHGLPTTEVRGSHIQTLWHNEMSNNKSDLRLLHHLRKEDMDPSTYDAMDVGAAMRFFSPKTKSALITAIEQGKLPKEALTTAHFVQLMYEYFSLMTSKLRKTSITSRNCDRIYIFLNVIIDLFQNTTFQKGWKPLNYAFVLATLSFLDAAEFLMKNGFDFVMGHRFTQDATENVFAQIRKRFRAMPSAKESLTGIKLISVSQYVSDIKHSSYMSDSDEYLLEYCKEKNTTQQESLHGLASEFFILFDEPAEASLIASNVQTLSLENLTAKLTNILEMNAAFYIAGSTITAVEKHVCSVCSQTLSCQNLPNTDYVTQLRIYTKHANQGGLKEPSWETLFLILHCEYYFQMYKTYILKKGNADLVQYLAANIDISFPSCCNVKFKLVKHFYNVRSFCVKSFTENYKPRKTIYGTASAKRKKL